MPRHAARIVCSSEELSYLEGVVSAHRSERRLVLRSNIILDCHLGMTNQAISHKHCVTLTVVRKWRGRFLSSRLGGLQDGARTGRPKIYGDDIRSRILSLLEQPSPKGQSSWDGGSIAKHLGICVDYVWKVLRKEGISLQRMRSWCVSTDKEFAAKAADVIGLYLNPPERAIVFSIDEKPSIQALSRKTGYVETSSGKMVRGLQSTYRRNGTLNLFAALNVATGTVSKKTTATKTRKDFQAFMEEVVKDIPLDREIHVIVDNYCTHKKNDDWLKAHPNVTFHFTPTSASWLNMVEIWFGILTRKALKGASFNSTQELAQAIEDFCQAYHKTAKPFVWKKREVKGSQLRNTIINLYN